MLTPARVGAEVERKYLGAVLASPELGLLRLCLRIIDILPSLAKLDVG